MRVKFQTLRRYWILSLGMALLTAGFLFLPSQSQPNVYAQAQPTPGPNSTSIRTVTVSGNGSVDVAPDMAIVSLGVQTDAQTASQALEQNNTQMKAVIDTLTKAGVASADIQTTTIQLSPRYETPSTTQGQSQATPTSHLVGYTATNTVQVKVHNLNNLGALLDQAVSAGGNQIQGISFDVSDPTQVMDQARQAAMNDATHKAQQLASLSNATLGPVFSISETSQSPIPFAAARAQAAGSNVPVSPGTQTVTVNLQVTWALQP